MYIILYHSKQNDNIKLVTKEIQKTMYAFKNVTDILEYIKIIKLYKLVEYIFNNSIFVWRDAYNTIIYL